MHHRRGIGMLGMCGMQVIRDAAVPNGLVQHAPASCCAALTFGIFSIWLLVILIRITMSKQAEYEVYKAFLKQENLPSILPNGECISQIIVYCYC